MKLHELFPEISLNPASAKDIKQWILQLAVEGKLTKKWRERFNRNLDWKKDILENLVSVSRGITFPKSEKSKVLSTGKIACLRTTNVQDHIEWDDLLYIDEIYVKNNGQYLKEGDIVMSMANSKELVGKVAIIENFNFDKASFGGFLAVLRSDVFFSKFLLYLLRSPQVKARLISSSSQTTNIANISVGRLNKLQLFIPPLEEQQAIVTTVEDLFKEVDALAQQATQRIALKRSYAQAALQRLCEADTSKEWQQIVSVFPEIFNDKQTIKTLRETILQLAVQGKLTAKWRSASSLEGGLEEGEKQTAHELLAQIKAEKAQLIKDKKIKAEKPLPPIEADEIPFELPEGWVWCRLGEVTDIQRGSSPRPKGDPLYFSSIRTEYHWISIKDITKNSVKNILVDTEEFLTLEGTKYSRYIKKEEIIVAVSGSTTGKSCISGIDGFIYDGLAVLKQINNGINHFFLALYMNQLYNQMNSSKFGAAFPNINTNLLNEMIMALPCYKEQQIIVEKVNALMGLCDELEREVEAKENILQKL